MKYTEPYATSTKPLAWSEKYNVFSDWGICFSFRIEDNKVEYEFEILNSWLIVKEWKILFKSSDWCKIQKWIEDHESEIVEQINKNAMDRIKKYYPDRLNEFVPESLIKKK